MGGSFARAPVSPCAADDRISHPDRPTLAPTPACIVSSCLFSHVGPVYLPLPLVLLGLGVAVGPDQDRPSLQPLHRYLVRHSGPPPQLGSMSLTLSDAG